MATAGSESGGLYRAFQLLSERGGRPDDAEIERLLPGDAAAQARLRAMLDAAARPRDAGGDDLTDAIAGRAGEAIEALALGDSLRAGTRLGDWEVVREIGHGGMARVYQVQRRLGEAVQHGALKLLGAGDAAGPRSLRERRLLAALDHPCIARLLDAGDDGPGGWLVMELVDGEPLDAHVSRQRATLAERVRLLADVADALAHAHRRLVVHRDLKPSNVLVDGEGRVRLIDFGIARSLDPDDAATATGEALLTLRYAAPEQLRGEPPSVAVDVYAFGLLAHELLLGRHAFDELPRFGLGERLAGAAVPAESTRAAARRASVPADLVAIVLRCLRAEPGARYGGADEVRDELRRWQRGRPVLARAGQRGYLARRFVARHWAALGAGAVVALALVLATLLSLREAREAELARAQATEVAGFLGALIGDLDPTGEVRVQRDLGFDELLELGHRRLAQSGIAPEPRATLLLQLARGFSGIGRADRAAGLAREALAALSRAPVTRTTAAMATEARMLELLPLHETDPGTAGARYRAILASLPADAAPSDRAAVLLALAQLLGDSGQAEGIDPLLAEAGALLARADPAPVRLELQLLAALADAAGREDRAAAIAPSQRYLERVREHFGERHEAYAVALANHAVRLEHAGDAEASGRLQELAWQLLADTVGPDHPNAESLATNYAIWLMRAGKLEQALVMQQHLIDARSRRYGPESAAAAGAWQNRATTLRRLGRWQEADAHAARAAAIYDRVMPPDSYLPAVPRLTRSQAALALGRPAQAAVLARDAGARLRDTLGADAMPTLVAELRLGEAELALGECARGRERVQATGDALAAIAHADAAGYAAEARRALAAGCEGT